LMLTSRGGLCRRHHQTTRAGDGSGFFDTHRR